MLTKLMLFLTLVTVGPAFGQIVSLGVKAGVPTGDAFTPDSVVTSLARRYLVGATAELHLPFRFSVELDAIYKKTGFDSAFHSTDIGIYTDHLTANQWEFPLLAKYELKGFGPVRPFVDAGPVLRHLTGISDTSTYLNYFPVVTSGTSVFSNSQEVQNRNSPGFAVGGGVTLKWWHLRVSPEIRYTHWGNNAFRTFLAEATATSNPNQTDVLVGFTF
jgi:hypothetical protein